MLGTNDKDYFFYNRPKDKWVFLGEPAGGDVYWDNETGELLFMVNKEMWYFIELNN